MNAPAQMTQSDLLKIIADQKAMIDKLAAQAASPARISLKVGEKGTVCLYHGARYPVAMYASQWERILPFIKSGEVEKFIEANRALLAQPKA